MHISSWVWWQKDHFLGNLNGLHINQWFFLTSKILGRLDYGMVYISFEVVNMHSFSLISWLALLPSRMLSDLFRGQKGWFSNSFQKQACLINNKNILWIKVSLPNYFEVAGDPASSFVAHSQHIDCERSSNRSASCYWDYFGI